MGDGETIDSVEFFKHLTEVREDNDKCYLFIMVLQKPTTKP